MPSSQAEDSPLKAAAWRTIVDTARDAILTIDRAGYITSFNRAAERIFGFLANEIIGKKVNLLMPSPYSKNHDQYMEDYHQTGTPKAIGRIRRVQALRKNGEVFPIELSVGEARVADQVIYTAVIRDVFEVERRYKLVFETAGCIIVVIATDGTILEFNREAERVYGRHRDQVVGKNYAELIIFPSFREQIRAELAKNLRGLASRGYETTVVTNTGVQTDVLWNSQRLSDESGNVVGVLSVGIDVTERKQATQSLRNLEAQNKRNEHLASLATMTAGIAHEVKNPLNAAHLQLTLLKRKLAKGTSDLKGALAAADIISDEIERVNTLLEEFLQFARPKPVRARELDLCVIATEVSQLFAPETALAGTKIEVYADAPVIATVDDQQMRQVLLNLVKNAIQASPPGGQITIRVISKPQQAILCVEDQGDGLSIDREKIFEPFFTTKESGTGLGLAITHRIVSNHGGSIEIDSIPGKTVFRVILPEGGALPLSNR